MWISVCLLECLCGLNVLVCVFVCVFMFLGIRRCFCRFVFTFFLSVFLVWFEDNNVLLSCGYLYVCLLECLCGLNVLVCVFVCVFMFFGDTTMFLSLCFYLFLSGFLVWFEDNNVFIIMWMFLSCVRAFPVSLFVFYRIECCRWSLVCCVFCLNFYYHVGVFLCTCVSVFFRIECVLCSFVGFFFVFLRL